MRRELHKLGWGWQSWFRKQMLDWLEKWRETMCQEAGYIKWSWWERVVGKGVCGRQMAMASMSEAPITVSSPWVGVESGFMWQIADIWGFTWFSEAVIFYLRLANLFFLLLFNAKKTPSEDNRNGTGFLSNCDLTIHHLFEVVGVLFSFWLLIDENTFPFYLIFSANVNHLSKLTKF